MTPPIGSRWRHHSGNVYEYIGVDDTDPTYCCHALQLVDRAPLNTDPLGHRITVELPWFEHAARRV